MARGREMSEGRKRGRERDLDEAIKRGGGM